MKSLSLSLFFLFILFTSQSQNLLTNGSFENYGELNCEGWYNADFLADTLCDDDPFWLIEFSDDTPFFPETWSIKLFADFPSYGAVNSFVTGISGTYVYKLSYYAKNIGAGQNVASFGLNNQNITNQLITENTQWQQFNIIDTLTTIATDSIVVNLSTAPADFCDCGAMFDIVELRIISTLNDDNCADNDIVFPVGSTQQGNYNTSASIESSGTITNHTKFHATERVKLSNGFSTPNNLNFTANNMGCNFSMNGWNISNLDPFDFNKIYLPEAYSSGVYFGDDTWTFGAYKSNHKVSFGNEEGPGTPGVPLVLTDPLPQIYNGYELRNIYSAFNNNSINGAFYNKSSGGSFRDRSGFYLHYNGSEYKRVLSVSYASESEQEVIAILETISPCQITVPATIRYDGSSALDGCEYIVTINGQDFKPVNQEVIDGSYFTGNPVEVTLTYVKVPGTIQPCFAPIYYNQLFIEAFVYN